ncbi:MAG: NeuD/PglB/VioB family sugar acetyltransferase, partial [Kofleriaceae bacterium]|nr:NeuD/PglB/VioB family sugar acetyltransferase [Kofleriaceae bacterium]
MTPLVVIGGGEHARVVIDAIRAQPSTWTLEGFVDPDPCTVTQQRSGIRWLGSDDEVLRDVAARFFVIGVGAVGVSDARRAIAARYDAAGARWATIVHPRATVSTTARLAPGVVVLANAVINTGAEVGVHGVINTGAIVEHDVTLGAFAQVGPGATLGGGVRVGDASYIGLGARVRDHISIGTRATVGMGAVVVG